MAQQHHPNHCLRPPTIPWNKPLTWKRIKMDRSLLEDEVKINNMTLKQTVLEEEIAIHNMQYRRRVIFTVVVTLQTAPPLNFEELRTTCKKAGLICPIGHICYSETLNEGGKNEVTRDLIALIYRPFQTLYSYLKDFDDRDPAFMKFVKGFVKGLYNLQQHGYAHASINLNTLVMGDSDRGGSLILLSLNQVGRSNDIFLKEFQRLGNRIKAGEKMIAEGNSKYSSDFRYLLKCMAMARSSPQRRRLTQAPFFYSNDEKVYYLITKLYISMWANFDFKLAAEGMTSWKEDFMNKRNKGDAVDVIWKETHPKFLSNAFQICQFLRNCVHHLNAKHAELVRKVEIAPFLKNSNLFIGFMEELLPNLLNKLFFITFSCKKVIFLFDFTTCPSKLLENEEPQAAAQQAK